MIDVPRIRVPKGTKVRKTKHIVKLVKSIADKQQEFGVVITLMLDLTVAAVRIVSIGCYNESTLKPRDCLRGAILDNAYGIVFVHNHPGGLMGFSKTDKKFIRELKKAGKVLDIEVIDAVVIHGKNWKSMEGMK